MLCYLRTNSWYVLGKRQSRVCLRARARVSVQLTGLFQYTVRLSSETEARFTSVERIQYYLLVCLSVILSDKYAPCWSITSFHLHVSLDSSVWCYLCWSKLPAVALSCNNNHGQVFDTQMPLSQSSIVWYWSKSDDGDQLSGGHAEVA